MLERVGGFPGRLQEAAGAKRKDGGKAQEKADFVETLKKFMSEVNSLQKEAGESIQRLASGDISNIHEVMVAVEKASVSFELMMEIRNKVLEAYREVMRMQV